MKKYHLTDVIKTKSKMTKIIKYLDCNSKIKLKNELKKYLDCHLKYNF